jgi:serine/threonine protein kinase
VTDLGISREFKENNENDTSGTPGYMAPEVMMRKPHSFAVDYFAVGVMAYELMLGVRPYLGANRKEIKEQIIAKQAAVKLDQLPFRWSVHALDFVNRLLLRNPHERLGANGIQEIKQHPWLADVDWEKMAQKRIKAPFRAAVNPPSRRTSRKTTKTTRSRFPRIRSTTTRTNWHSCCARRPRRNCSRGTSSAATWPTSPARSTPPSPPIAPRRTSVAGDLIIEFP